ncbi:hypothetical protein O6H91_03G117100 [Diphasiastrum complanatum]|uniref:Uncharacterized protein n=1 Tax=Diphasiastrum complanatum TaxID=34168 RepID=A0ACC2EAH0_DIPCM|nr:hypothetical protein O6H91_03G117100 [Diphasiastrum complanatum]
MALVAVLEADLRSLSSEARRKYPAVKDAAEHAILKIRNFSDPSQIARNDDILRIFLLACDAKNAKLSVIGLSCLQKLIAHDAVAPSALPQILATLKEHAEINDETIQLKTLQAILTILQSQLHPEEEENMAIVLEICLRLLGNNRNLDSVHSTAAATLRQAVALIFDRVITAEALPVHKVSGSRRTSRSNSVSGDVSRSILAAKNEENAMKYDPPQTPDSKETLTQASWLRVTFLQRTFALDMLEYVLSNYVSLFRKLRPYEQVLRHQVCSLLMTSLRTTGEIEGEVGEPGFRRLVLRSVANVIRLYSSIVTMECEVFLSMLVKSTDLDLPLWHRIMVLEILRGFCVEARILRLLFQTFDMRPENTNVVAGMVKALARVVTSVQVPEVNEESLVAVAGMFNSKAKGVEWTLEYDASSAAVMVASEAHAITLAVEGLLGVVFTVATLTDEAIDAGELASPRCEATGYCDSSSEKQGEGELATLCTAIVAAVWDTLLDALSLILSRSQGEAIVLEILKGYQAFTQACGVLRAVEPRDAFLASLCKFTLVQNEQEKLGSSNAGAMSPLGKRAEQPSDQREAIVLTPKNVQALRTLFNIAHRLDSVLGSSWALVLETLAVLDRVIHSPHATTQEVSAVVPRVTRESGSHSSDFNILSTLDAQLFESSAMMSSSAVSSLIAALRQVSNIAVAGVTTGVGQAVSGTGSTVVGTLGASMQQTGVKLFAVERMIATLINNLHRAPLFWDQIMAHFLELAEHESPQVRSVALDALDRSIGVVLSCDQIRKDSTKGEVVVRIDAQEQGTETTLTIAVKPRCESQGFSIDNGWQRNIELDTFECRVLLHLRNLYNLSQNAEVRSGALKILLHVLERHGEKLYHSWPSILELLRSVANASAKELVPLGFQSLRVIMNDGLLSVPAWALEMCVEVAGAYGAQKRDINISLTAIGLLWTTSDFFSRGVNYDTIDIRATRRRLSDGNSQISPRDFNEVGIGPETRNIPETREIDRDDSSLTTSTGRVDMDSDKLLLAVFGVIQSLGTDDRPEVRNSAITTLFQSINSHGYQLSVVMWKHCLWNLIFPLLDTVRHLAANSSKDEWTGKELGVQRGKPVHMLVHHSRNTAQKQWDETLVLVLNGMSRLLKLYFNFFQTLENFKTGWDSLLRFIQESVIYGSKEVALAAISSLQTVLIHGSKGSMLDEYFESAFTTYEKVVHNAAHYRSKVATRARQELLQSLGELYRKAYNMFEASSYLRILALVDLLIRCPLTARTESTPSHESLPQVQRIALDVLPMLKPLNDRLFSMWSVYLQQMLSYLPGGDLIVCDHCKVPPPLSVKEEQPVGPSQSLENSQSPAIDNETLQPIQLESINLDSRSQQFEMSPAQNSRRISWSDETVAGTLSPAFSEKIISILVVLYGLAPSTARSIVLPDIVAVLGRCMAMRRDSPDASIWKTAVTAFNNILEQSFADDLASEQKLSEKRSLVNDGPRRPQFWKELAESYENFLVGACGRAATLSSDETVPSDSLKTNELLEARVLDVLCGKVFAVCQDAPHEVLERLVNVIDRCAARTSALPLEAMVLLPPHCGRFSLACLHKLFQICSWQPGLPILSSKLAVSRIALPVLISRSESIICQFAQDDQSSGDPLPQFRIEELLFVLQELSTLEIHPLTATVLDISVKDMEDEFSQKLSTTHSRAFSSRNFDAGSKQTHLLLLYSALCELVISRDERVSKLLRLLLRLIGVQLGLISNYR